MIKKFLGIDKNKEKEIIYLLSIRPFIIFTLIITLLAIVSTIIYSSVGFFFGCVCSLIIYWLITYINLFVYSISKYDDKNE